MEGHGRLSTRNPLPTFTGLPLSSTTSAPTPGRGRVAEPGLAGVAPGMGEIMMLPVSVCHQVSTIGHLPLPITRSYQCHAVGLIGSPTEPSRRNDDRSCEFGQSSPCRTKERIAVGEVYRMVTRYFSISRQKRSGLGQSGAPSNISVVAPAASGPYTTYECPVTQPM